MSQCNPIVNRKPAGAFCGRRAVILAALRRIARQRAWLSMRAGDGWRIAVWCDWGAQSMTKTTREEDLKQVPLAKGTKSTWPAGVRSISQTELDLLGVDNNGRLYWEGRPVAVSRRLTGWQTLGAFVVGTFVVVGGIGSFAQGWAVYHDWACKVGWPAITCPASSR
jgi:hypothetical protein